MYCLLVNCNFGLMYVVIVWLYIWNKGRNIIFLKFVYKKFKIYYLNWLLLDKLVIYN